MKKFLTEAAERIINNGHIGAQSVIILPNRRSEVFLKEEIKKLTNTNIWLPEFYPIDEFIQKISGLEKLDNISIFFELYKIHQKIAGDEAKTIDEFLTWAPVMLSDFNDIDSSMADAKEIFSQLSAIKAIQQWNPDGKPLTQLQENYLLFFNSMYNYYSDLESNLLATGSGYQGLINRHVAENTPSLLRNQHWNNFLIIGLNALSESEILIIDFINKNYNTSFLWDVDSYYFSNQKSNSKQEAGKQIRRVIDRLKLGEPDNISDNLTTSKKVINILAIPKNIGQAKYIGQEIDKHFNQKDNLNTYRSQLNNTAIVLANEELLIPLLNSLPEIESKGEKHYNVTLGFPLSSSPIEQLFSRWIEMIITKSQTGGKIHTSNLISFLNNPILKQLLQNNDGERLIKYLITKNISVITSDEIRTKFNSNNNNSLNILTSLLQVNKDDSVATILYNLKTTLTSTISVIPSNILIKEQIQQLIKIISKLIILSSENKNIINLNAVKKVGRQLIHLSKINLIGEPLNGIQIMGMLETRNLDFENIYILSANEGIIPKTNSINSFIPLDIRSLRKLPIPSDKSDIYAYHFYRLLQRASNIHLVYNSDMDKLGAGEKSRFILQIENELSKINSSILLNEYTINTKILANEGTKTNGKKIVIPKTENIISKLTFIGRNGYSASSLNTYIVCPLKFYFSNVIKISTTDMLQQSVEANTFGTVIHAVLEYIYKPMIGKIININTINDYLKNTRHILTKQFQEHYNDSELDSGKNLLIFEVAHNYIVEFLKWDINHLKQNSSKLHSTEAKLFTNSSVNSTLINFKGYIDRIDLQENNNTIRIIDYKTGKVVFDDLDIKNTEELTTNPKYSKAFQVMFYAWLYYRNYPVEKLETGIISLRSISAGFIPLKLREYDKIQDYFDEFTTSIEKIIVDILDADMPFNQTEDTSSCKWCDYKSICNM